MLVPVEYYNEEFISKRTIIIIIILYHGIRYTRNIMLTVVTFSGRTRLLS